MSTLWYTMYMNGIYRSGKKTSTGMCRYGCNDMYGHYTNNKLNNTTIIISIHSTLVPFKQLTMTTTTKTDKTAGRVLLPSTIVPSR